MAVLGAIVTPVVLAACYGAPPGTDADGDGYPEEEDCNDADAAVNPGAGEICDDTIDNDCDGAIDSADTDCGDLLPVALPQLGACGAIDSADTDCGDSADSG